MIRTRLALSALALALSLAAPVGAQDMRALAQAYVDLPANQQMMADMLSPQSMAAQFAAGLPPGTPVSDAQLAEIGALMATTMADVQPLMRESMIETAATTFTEAELRALTDFYSSEVGSSILLKMQPFFQATMADIQPRIMQQTQAIIPQIIAIMQGN